jgi:endonuclease/exonuclease/phosphatase family metal-dependent hydrolase
MLSRPAVPSAAPAHPSSGAATHAAARSESATLRIMTYNVHSCVGTDGSYDPERVASVIEEASPDIVALQEVDVGLERSSHHDQADWLAQRLGMRSHFTCARFAGAGQYGNAILSRYSLALYSEGCLPGRGGERRAVQWVRIELGNVEVDVLNTHLSTQYRERVLQVKALVGSDWVARAEQDAFLIICGDFNSMPFSPICRMLTRTLVDAQRAAGGDIHSTWPSSVPLMRIDHVFTSRSLAVRSAHVPRTALARLASDHLPLIVDVRVPARLGDTA